MPGTPNLTYVGYTPGSGAGEVHATPDLTGFVTAYQQSGPGAPAATGAQYSRCIKYFRSPAEGYPNFPGLGGSQLWPGTNLAAIVAAATTPIFPLVAFGSAPVLAIPSATQIQAYIQSLPAGLQCGWIYVSEVEAGTDLPAGGPNGYVANVATFSTNLNQALATLRQSTGSGFYNRANFVIVHSARMDHYSSSGDDTGTPVIDQSWIPNAGTCDCYGMDLYHKGTRTNAPASTGARAQGFIRSVQAKIGTAVAFGFPEYGIDLNGTGMTAAGRAQLLNQDFAYMTGSARPGTLPVMFWNYWYQVGNSGEHYLFNGASDATMISQWQQMVAYSESNQGQNTITVINPGLQTNTVGDAVSLQISASDSDPSLNNALTYSLGNTLLPPTLQLNRATGKITGTCTTPGTFTAITVTVTDGTGASGQATFSWQVNQPTTETVTVINPGTQTSTKGLAIPPLNIQASDSRGFALTYSMSGQPTGLSINPANGQITGTPTATGTFPTVTVTAVSATPVSNNAVFPWNIAASVVTVASPGNQVNVTNDQVSIQVTATDSANLPVSFSATGLPTGLSISAAGLITGTCTTPGTYNTVITGTDTAAPPSTGQAAFTWTVQAIVVTVDNPGNVINNTFDVVSLQIIARDSADQALTYSDGGTLPPGLVVAAATGLITGQPTTAGIYQVTITATDVSLVTGAATFTWTINQAATVLVVSIAPAPGTDQFGNAYPAGVTVGPAGGTQTTIGLDGTLHYSPKPLAIGNMVNGWARNTANGGHAGAALDVLGNLVVSFKNLQVGTTTDGTLIFAQGAFPAGARPHDNRRVAASTNVMAAAVSPQLEFRTDGSVAVYGVGATATRVDYNGTLPLRP